MIFGTRLSISVPGFGLPTERGTLKCPCAIALARLSGLVFILLLLLTSCDFPADRPSQSPNATREVANLPIPASVEAYPDCDTDSELGRLSEGLGGTPAQLIVEIGFRTEESGAVIPVPHESYLVMGDISILDVRATVHYVSHDVEALVSISVADPEGCPDDRILRFAAQAVLSETVGMYNASDLLSGRRSEIEQGVRYRLQEVLHLYGARVQVQNVALRDVQPPEEVRAAFDDVLQARQDREIIVNQAESYENAAVRQARLEARQIIESAKTARDVRLADAQEDVWRFVSILKEYNHEKDAAFKELHLETMEDILPGVAAFIVAGTQSQNSAGDNLGAAQQRFSMAAINPVPRGASGFKGAVSSSTSGSGVRSTLGLTGRGQPSNSRLFLVDPAAIEVLDTDNKELEVDVFAVVRIVEPEQIRDFTDTVLRLSDVCTSALELEITGRTHSEVIGAAVIVDPRGVPVTDEDGIVKIRAANSRSETMNRVMGQVNARVNEMGLGVEVVDLRIKGLRFPYAIETSIFERMRSQRQLISSTFRAEGEERAASVRADADRQSAFILGEARREAAAITGEAEVAIIDATLVTLTQDPELYAYEKALRAYRVSRAIGN